jgi:pentatricopeptide repeat protein
LEGLLKEALDLLNAINEVGVIVESDIYAHLLQACANLKSLGVGRQIHSLIVKSGIYPNAFLGTRLVNMYAKCGSLADARLAFDVMPERNVFSWNTIIGVCARDGRYEAAIELYYQMLDLGFEPDNFTFPSVLKACAGLAALEQGKEIHDHIKKCGFESDVFVGNGLVDMYAKCGCIEEARQVFDKMHLLFLSLYFKALKYTVKASEKTEGADDKKRYDKKMRAIVGSSTVSVEIPSFPGY